MEASPGNYDDDRSDRSRRVPLERQLSESHAVLWSVVLVSAVFDILTTLVGIHHGFREGNVVARAFLETYGSPGIGALKFVALVVLVLSWSLLSERKATLVLTVFAVVSLAVVAWNALILLGI